MGLTVRGFAYTILVALAILLALRKPARVHSEASARSHDDRARELSLRVTRARFNWTAWDRRDSALASRNGPTVSLSGFSTGARLVEPESAYVATAIAHGVRDSAVQVSLHLYQADTYGASWWGLYFGSLITTSPAIKCAAILPASQGRSGRVVAGKHRLAAVLSPCLLLGSFGAPGPTVGTWLRQLRYAPAGSSEWLTRTSDDQDSGPWAWMADGSFWGARAQRRSTLGTLLGLEQITQLLAPPYHFGQMGVQCLSGIKASCARGVLDPGVLTQETRQMPPELTIAPSQIRSADITILSSRPPGATFLSDLIEEKGKERFSMFWKSDTPFEKAFEDAFEEPLADWTYRWARKRWLMMFDAQYRSSDILVGVTFRPLWILVLVGWSVLAIGTAGWVARRRQVTSI